MLQFPLFSWSTWSNYLRGTLIASTTLLFNYSTNVDLIILYALPRYHANDAPDLLAPFSHINYSGKFPKFNFLLDNTHTHTQSWFWAPTGSFSVVRKVWDKECLRVDDDYFSGRDAMFPDQGVQSLRWRVIKGVRQRELTKVHLEEISVIP